MTGPPSAEVLEAFGVRGTPELMAGGRGRTWVVDGVVLKPVDDAREHAWVCEVYDGWTSDAVGVPQPVRAGGAWSSHGWAAHVHVPGATARAGNDPGWFAGVHEAFHDAVADLPRPAFLDDRRDAWSVGDRVAWEGVPPHGSPATVALLERALAQSRPVDLAAQVVHGDLGGNVLRDGGRGAVIDWPPYWRPRTWALAVVVTDAVCWEGADPSLLDLRGDDPDWAQLLLRAVVYRLATRGDNEVTGSMPVGSDGYLAEKARILRLVEQRLR